MRKSHTLARLLINDVDVGQVRVQGWDDSWGFGQFTPALAFARFADLFARWSLLMHADDEGAPVCEETLDALREAEYAIDALRARLILPEAQQCRRITQLNIDGPLIEWREDGLEEPAPARDENVDGIPFPAAAGRGDRQVGLALAA